MQSQDASQGAFAQPALLAGLNMLRPVVPQPAAMMSNSGKSLRTDFPPKMMKHPCLFLYVLPWNDTHRQTERLHYKTSATLPITQEKRVEPIVLAMHADRCEGCLPQVKSHGDRCVFGIQCMVHPATPTSSAFAMASRMVVLRFWCCYAD